jgi:hypothetical protein
VTPREELHKLIDEIDDEREKTELHAEFDELDDASIPDALASMREIRRLLRSAFDIKDT